MAYVSPRTWVTGEIVTAAMMNQDVRDNIGHLGGMKRNATLFSALAGSSEILGNWGAKAYSNANISIPDITWTNLTFNVETWDSGTIHDTGSNTQNFTAPVAGKYLVVASVYWVGNATGIRQIRVTKGGTQQGEAGGTVGNNQAHSQRYTDIVSCAASDVLVFQVYQNTGGNLDVTQVTTYGISAAIQWIGV